MIVDKRDFGFLLAWAGLGEVLARPRYAAHDQADVDAILDLALTIAEADGAGMR